MSYITISIIPLLLGFYLWITFATRIFLEIRSEDKILGIFLKIFLYILFLVIYIFINIQLSARIDKLLGLVITIYFSWDRLFSILRDIEDMIHEESVLYYSEEENISDKLLKKKYVNYNLISKNSSENEIVIQTIIRCRIAENECVSLESKNQTVHEINGLCNYYQSSNFESYYMFMKYIEILTNKDAYQENKYLCELKKLFYENNDIDNQQIIPINGIYECINILFEKKEYKSVVLLYRKYSNLITLNSDKDIISKILQAARVTDESLTK